LATEIPQLQEKVEELNEKVKNPAFGDEKENNEYVCQQLAEIREEFE